jgi:hypothetical protein
VVVVCHHQDKSHLMLKQGLLSRPALLHKDNYHPVPAFQWFAIWHTVMSFILGIGDFFKVLDFSGGQIYNAGGDTIKYTNHYHLLNCHFYFIGN